MPAIQALQGIEDRKHCFYGMRGKVENLADAHLQVRDSLPAIFGHLRRAEHCGLKSKFWMVRKRQLSICVLAIISSVVGCFAAAACRVSSTLGSSSLAAIMKTQELELGVGT